MKFAEIPKYPNSLVVGHMQQAIQHLVLAYNAAQNDSEIGRDSAWGIALALASVSSQAQGLGCLCGSSAAANESLEFWSGTK